MGSSSTDEELIEHLRAYEYQTYDGDSWSLPVVILDSKRRPAIISHERISGMVLRLSLAEGEIEPEVWVCGQQIFCTRRDHHGEFLQRYTPFEV